MSKGSSKAAMNQVGIDNAYASQYNANANSELSQLFPFLTGEINNPQGFGDATVAKMKTEGGQAAAGAVGQAREAGDLLASRTGNTAAVPGIIDVASRNAMRQESNNALGVDIANEEEKLKQQQAGAAGLTNLTNSSENDALKALGLTDESINAWTGAKQAADNDVFNWTKLGLQTAMGGASMGLAASGVPH